VGTRLNLGVSALIGLVAFSPSSTGQEDRVNDLTPEERAAGFVQIFNGRDLTGWTTSGDIDAWSVDGGNIVTSGRGGWWLRTEKQYRDFELRLEFRIPENGNSGVGLRGSTNGDPAFTGMEIQIYDNHGDEPAINGCGAVYNAIVPSAQAVHEPGEWNEYRIRLVGDTLNVWLNGEHIHDDQKLDERGYFRQPSQKMPLQDRLTTGYVSLQDHGNPVRYRNIRIKDMSPYKDPGGWTPIFNGKDTTGWTARGGGTWTVDGGTLVGKDGPGHLFSNGTWTDVEMRAMVKVNERGNSGFYFRTVPNADDPDTWPTGYEAQVDNHDPKNFTGCVYARAWADELITRDEAWFDYRVRAVGNRIQTWINGQPMVDTELTDFASGHIALQTHHNGNEIRWRDIQVRDLSASMDKKIDRVSP